MKKKMIPRAGGGYKGNAEIDIMKLIASVTIVFHHSVYATNTEASWLWTGGYMSVVFFFFISGYLMANSAVSAGPCERDRVGYETAKFMLRKWKGILPWHLFAWGAAYLIICLYNDFSLREQGKVIVGSIFPNLFAQMTGLDGFEVVGAVWYLSAMYLCMPVIYFFLRTHRDIFIWIAAPLLSLFLFGYLNKEYGGLGVAVMTWNGFCYGGIIYAAAGLSCGCFCYGISEWMKKQSWTKFSCIIISFLDIGTFIFCLILMQLHPEASMNVTLAFLFAVVVILSFSGKSYTTEFFNRFFSTSLIRDFSIAIYLCHGRIYIILEKYFQMIKNYETRLFLYLLFCFLLSFFCVIFVRAVKMWYQKYKCPLNYWFLAK